MGKWCAEDSEAIRIRYDIGLGDSRSREMQQIEFFDNGKFVFWGSGSFGEYKTVQGDYAICDNYTVILSCAYGDKVFHFNVSGEALLLWDYGAQARKEIIGDEDIEIVQYIKQ